MKLLALDLATNVGWATHANGIITYGEYNCKRIHGKKKIPDEHMGAAYFKFRNFLTDKIREDKVTHIAVEGTGYFASASARDVCCGFRGILLEVAARFAVPVATYAPTSVKKHWTGHGNAMKPDMIAECVKRGFADVGEDSADAVALLHLHLANTADLPTLAERTANPSTTQK